MEQIELGMTGVQIPVIGFGTAGLQGGVEPIRKAVSMGANLIDTAESYGTDEVVGEAIQDIRDQVFVATKVSAEHFRHDDVLKAADGSLQRMGIDRIDLYQLHWPSADIPLAETMQAMDELVDQGKIRFVGVSNFSVAQIEEAQAASKNPVVSNQVIYSLAKRGIEEDVLPYCQENGITVIAYSPLAHLVGNASGGSVPRALQEVANEVGKPAAQTALNWCISHPNVMAIPKSDSVDRTAENCDRAGWRLSEAQVRKLDG